jgi:hypothetical protein
LTSLRNASIADQTVGKAAAFLFVYSRANSVFAVTISEKGLNYWSRTMSLPNSGTSFQICLARRGPTFVLMRRWS